jgi:hypothetical protein
MLWERYAECRNIAVYIISGEIIGRREETFDNEPGIYASRFRGETGFKPSRYAIGAMVDDGLRSAGSFIEMITSRRQVEVKRTTRRFASIRPLCSFLRVSTMMMRKHLRPRPMVASRMLMASGTPRHG